MLNNGQCRAIHRGACFEPFGSMGILSTYGGIIGSYNEIVSILKMEL